MKFMISMNDDLKNKVDAKASEMYMSKSGFISMCVAQYFANNDAMTFMQSFPDVLKKIEELQKKGGNDGILQDIQGKQE